MSTWSQRITGLVAGLLVLGLADMALNPVPVAAPPAFILGALAWLWILGKPLVLAASVAGAVGGSVVQFSWHLSGKSPLPAEGLYPHLAVEGLIGLAVALFALFVMSIVSKTLA